MIRLLSVIVVSWGVACAQSNAAPGSLMATKASKETSSDAITPNTIVPGNDVRKLTELPALPDGKVTLIGGTVQRVDHLRDRLVLQAFGGGRFAVLFDERTRVYRDGKTTSLDSLKNGERAYVDTMLDGTQIFARNIRIAAQTANGQSSGQIVEYQPATGELRLRDTVSPETAILQVTSSSSIRHGDKAATAAELRPGTLVALTFTPGNGKAPVVREISILASPGATFAFAGRIEHLDLRRGLLVLVDPRDNKSYEMSFDPAARNLIRDLKQKADVSVQTVFDGRRYQVRDVTVTSTPHE
jgi:hypothetical protein